MYIDNAMNHKPYDTIVQVNNMIREIVKNISKHENDQCTRKL